MDHTNQHQTSSGPPLTVGVIAGSTRPTRRSPAIAHWVASETTVPTLRLDVIDLCDVDLPLLREPQAAVFGHYKFEATQRWARTIERYDAFVLVTPEYNASFTAVLKNALDHLYAEWHDKPVALVGYGMAGGLLAVEALRPVVAELRMPAVTTTLALSPHRVRDGIYTPEDGEEQARATMLTELARLGSALRRAQEVPA